VSAAAGAWFERWSGSVIGAAGPRLDLELIPKGTWCVLLMAATRWAVGSSADFSVRSADGAIGGGLRLGSRSEHLIGAGVAISSLHVSVLPRMTPPSQSATSGAAWAGGRYGLILAGMKLAVGVEARAYTSPPIVRRGDAEAFRIPAVTVGAILSIGADPGW
jgi:hypothetical protein